MKKYCLLTMIVAVILFSTLPISISTAAEKKERSWKDESIYYIMIDRFNDADSKNLPDVDAQNPLTYNGGDFQGIINKLDYIKGMSFTAISLTPIFASASRDFDGYQVKDFHKTDPHFGSLKTFQKLVSEAHKRNMKVMVDFPASRVGADHPNEAIREAKWWMNKTNLDGYRLIAMDDMPVQFWSRFFQGNKERKK